MKNQKILFLSILVSIGISSACFAQNSTGDLQLEAGIGYGSEIQSLAFRGGAVYQINEEFRAAANGIYYLPGDDSNGVEYNWLEFNANGHYLFVNGESNKFYALTGLNFAKLFSDSANIRLPSGDDTDQIYVGLNIGAGADFSLGSVNAFVEGKYALSSAHQLVVSGGIRIPL